MGTNTLPRQHRRQLREPLQLLTSEDGFIYYRVFYTRHCGFDPRAGHIPLQQGEILRVIYIAKLGALGKPSMGKQVFKLHQWFSGSEAPPIAVDWRVLFIPQAGLVAGADLTGPDSFILGWIEWVLLFILETKQKWWICLKLLPIVLALMVQWLIRLRG